MENEISTLVIKAERLGSIAEIKGFLTDIENAYNSIYAFEFIVDSLNQNQKRKIQQLDDRFHKFRQYGKEIYMREKYPFDPLFFEVFLEDYYRKSYETAPNLIELQRTTEIEKIILPGDRLKISKINIQSPGFWEFLGSLNPLQQIREYLKDRHERKKDKKFRDRQEEETKELEITEKKNNILNQRIEILKSLGYSEIEIRQFVLTMVIEPLYNLGRHQDNGQIEGPSK